MICLLSAAVPRCGVSPGRISKGQWDPTTTMTSIQLRDFFSSRTFATRGTSCKLEANANPRHCRPKAMTINQSLAGNYRRDALASSHKKLRARPRPVSTSPTILGTTVDCVHLNKTGGQNFGSRRHRKRNWTSFPFFLRFLPAAAPCFDRPRDTKNAGPRLLEDPSCDPAASALATTGFQIDGCCKTALSLPVPPGCARGLRADQQIEAAGSEFGI
ncbi:hypothetical protein B0T24DRAFT_403297 [Lasiosphaeria ovina]|uniref:Uncharacterized protein n=1 Tax=Lasiosphaeria ovina TaxID=92902 RepID=A0AAE0N0L9_9PEZI|nr:hypothetical protein B0T24DRAFT_403297 [Lasiosphaeria ovina]